MSKKRRTKATTKPAGKTSVNYPGCLARLTHPLDVTNTITIHNTTLGSIKNWAAKFIVCCHLHKVIVVTHSKKAAIEAAKTPDAFCHPCAMRLINQENHKIE